MFRKIRQEAEGQALVEFALVIVILLFVVFMIIDGGRLFQAWLTVQNSARAAARYAVTGQYDNTGNFTTPECPAGTPVSRWQVCSIKDQAFQTASGLNIDVTAGPTQPLAFGTQICQPDNCPPEGTGGAGEPTRVSVFYNAELITPLLRPFAEFIRVKGQVEVVTAQYDQVSPGDIVIANVGGGVGGPAFPHYADLAITKASTNSEAVGVMETANYTITVKNFGPFYTPSIDILDLLPSGTVSMTNYSITNNDGPIPEARCSFSSLDQQLVCFLPGLDGDPDSPGTAIIDVDLLIAPSDLESDPYKPTIVVTNTASVFNQIATLDPNPLNNEATANTTIKRWYDLELTKTYPPGQSSTVNLGDTVAYLIHAENTGPSTAVNVVVTDTLPLGLEFIQIASLNMISAEGTATCDDSGNVIQCDLSELAYGEYIEFTVEAMVVDAGGDLENKARVIPDNPEDVDKDNNFAKVTTATTAPDLQVTKSVIDTMFTEVGGVYNIHVHNNSIDGKATNVVLTDDMQPGPGVSIGIQAMSMSGTDPSRCEIQGGEDIVCQGFDIAPGGDWFLQVPIVPKLEKWTDSSYIDNVVDVSSNVGLYNAAPASASTILRREYDLGVFKTEDIVDIDDGILRYEVTVTNHGPSTSLDFNIVDQLMVETDGTGLSPVVTEVDGDYIASTGACSVDSGTYEIVCQVIEMPAGKTASFTVQVDLTDFSGRIRNRATVSDKDNLPDDEEEADSFSTGWLIYPYALAITKIGDITGEEDVATVYTIRVANRGVLSATFDISDVLNMRPLDLIDVVFISTTDASCPATSTGSFECRVNDLVPGKSAIIKVEVTPTSGGILTNTATAIAPDSVSWLNSGPSSVTTTFSPLADLEANLSLYSAITDTIILQLDVANLDDLYDSTAENVLITDSIYDISGTVVSLTISPSPVFDDICNQVTGTFTSSVSVECNLDSLGDKSTATFYVEVVFEDESGNQFASEALVESDTFDPAVENNTYLYEWK